jgi:hypothetical protein
MHISRINQRGMGLSSRNIRPQNQNFSHIYNLKQELTQIKQGNHTNGEYLTALRRKLKELKLYLPPTTDLKEI